MADLRLERIAWPAFEYREHARQKPAGLKKAQAAPRGPPIREGQPLVKS